MIALMNLSNLKRICCHNFQQAYQFSKTEKDYQIMTVKYLKQVAALFTDMLYYLDRPEKLSNLVDISSEVRLKQALKQNKGVICVTAHLGNFPLMFQSLIQRGYKVNVIIRPMRSRKFGKFMHKLCAEWGIHMIETVPARDFIKKSFAALNRNELLFILLDEVVPSENGVEVEFFNSKVVRALGPMLFHRRTQSPILPIFTVQDVNKRFKIIVEEEAIVKCEGKALSEAEVIVYLSSVIEKYVREFPLQWGGWFNKRWFSI